jgi:DNA polymerase-3 subunit gamma/tau
VSAGSSLYRRHRPRSFAEVVGQQHVVQTLTNAVQRDRVHHAYLFVGSRGTGKTSMAKILAACLNCAQGPTVTPCGRCESCVTIAAASSLDVIEMDAASSNSVDDIRALRESVAYAPVSGRQKVYILDEAHMLSTAAWNAFLKTLEEPPPNTVFVLATTDPQKVLPTVVDRCHRFDFQRPTVEQIVTVLDRVARAESIEIGREAIAVLARHAAGSFRDALGTLEQLQTYAGSQIALSDVLSVLGISDVELLVRAADAIAAADARAALAVVAEAVEGGRDPAGFIRELEAHARELLIVQMHDGIVPAELSVTADRDERLAEQAGALTTAALIRTLDLLATALTHLKAGADARTQLELAVVRAARPDLDPTLSALATRVEALETGAPVRERAPAHEPAAAEPAAEAPTPVAERPAPVAEASAPVVEAPAPGAEQPAPAHEAPAAVPPRDAVETLSLEDLRRVWPTVLDTVRATNAMLSAVVGDAEPVELAGDKLVLAFGEDAAFVRRKAEERANRAAISEAVRAVTGHVVTLSYESRAGQAAPAAQPLSEDELVARLVDEFDAEVLGDTDEEAR